MTHVPEGKHVGLVNPKFCDFDLCDYYKKCSVNQTHTHTVYTERERTEEPVTNLVCGECHEMFGHCRLLNREEESLRTLAFVLCVSVCVLVCVCVVHVRLWLYPAAISWPSEHW